MIKVVVKIAAFIASVGAVNWGLKSFWDLDLVDKVAKSIPSITHLDKVLYGVVAVCGLLTILALFASNCSHCSCK